MREWVSGISLGAGIYIFWEEELLSNLREDVVGSRWNNGEDGWFGDGRMGVFFSVLSAYKKLKSLVLEDNWSVDEKRVS